MRKVKTLYIQKLDVIKCTSWNTREAIANRIRGVYEEMKFHALDALLGLTLHKFSLPENLVAKWNKAIVRQSVNYHRLLPV